MLELIPAILSSVALAIARRLRSGPSAPGRGWALEIAVAANRAAMETMSRWSTRKMQRASREASSRAARRLRFSQVTLAGIRAEVSEPADCEDPPILLYLHGGGFVQGSPATHRDMVSVITLAAGCRTYSLDYRLASQNKFPAAPDDAYDAFRTLAATVADPKRLVIAGDSAGGNLCLGLLMRLRDRGEPLPAAAVLICPAPDLEFPGDTWEGAEQTDWITREICESWIGHYVPKTKRGDPLASPLRGDLSGLPPMLIQAGTAEGLYAEIVALVRKLASSGVDVRFSEYAGMPHVWHLFRRLTREGDRALGEIGAYVREQTGARYKPIPLDMTPKAEIGRRLG